MSRIALTSLVLLLSSMPVLAQDEGAPAATPPASTNPVAVMKTTMGTIEIELFEKQAPETVANFIGLAEGTKPWNDPVSGDRDVKKPFYDGLTFHRVIDGFMIQGGDPLGTGEGGPGYAFRDEISAKSLGLDEEKVMTGEAFSPRLIQPVQQAIMRALYVELGITDQASFDAKRGELIERLRALSLKKAYEMQGYRYDDTLTSTHPVRGVIAMANAGPATNGSQFFINLVDTPHLAGKHTVFGKVVKGMDVVDAIGKVKVNAVSKPEKPVKIETLTIRRPEAKKAEPKTAEGK